MKLGGHRLVRRSIFLAAACMLALMLTACTGKGGGYLPPDGTVFTRPGIVRLHIQLREG